MLNEEKINYIIEKIKLISNPDKIYIFGSYAYGKPLENSDLDILIIKNNVKNRLQEIINIKKEIISKDYSIDILLYTEDEYLKKIKEGWQLFDEISKKGKLYYAA